MLSTLLTLMLVLVVCVPPNHQSGILFSRMKDISNGEVIQLAGTSVRVLQNTSVVAEEDVVYGFEIKNTTELALELSEDLDVEAVELEASIFKVSLTAAPAQRILTSRKVNKAIIDRPRTAKTYRVRFQKGVGGPSPVKMKVFRSKRQAPQHVKAQHDERS